MAHYCFNVYRIMHLYKIFSLAAYNAHSHAFIIVNAAHESLVNVDKLFYFRFLNFKFAEKSP